MGAAIIPLMVTGTVMTMIAQRQEGAARREMAGIRAAGLEEEADRTLAVSQREKEEVRRKTTLIASRALALQAVSGAGTTDPTAIKLMADIEGEGAYRESVALYRGEEEARGLRKEAKVVRRGGELEYRAAKTRSIATAISGAGTIAGMYKPRGRGGSASDIASSYG